MKAVRAHEIGGPDVLKYEDVPEASPGSGEALLDIRSIGVNYTDVSSRKGTNPPPSLPWTPGREAAGVVKAVGEGVTEVAVGDRVAYAMHTGSYSEEAVVPSWLLVRLPDVCGVRHRSCDDAPGHDRPFPHLRNHPAEPRRLSPGPRRGGRRRAAPHPDVEEGGSPCLHHRFN